MKLWWSLPWRELHLCRCFQGRFQSLYHKQHQLHQLHNLQQLHRLQQLHHRQLYLQVRRVRVWFCCISAFSHFRISNPAWPVSNWEGAMAESLGMKPEGLRRLSYSINMLKTGDLGPKSEVLGSVLQIQTRNPFQLDDRFIGLDNAPKLIRSSQELVKGNCRQNEELCFRLWWVKFWEQSQWQCRTQLCDWLWFQGQPAPKVAKVQEPKVGFFMRRSCMLLGLRRISRLNGAGAFDRCPCAELLLSPILGKLLDFRYWVQEEECVFTLYTLCFRFFLALWILMISILLRYTKSLVLLNSAMKWIFSSLPAAYIFTHLVK